MIQQKSVFGFLTVIEHARYGVFGGYLLLNEAGRPLEFHCTAPIRPNRAQEILYGVTLRPYLYGEQIGQALLNKSKERPTVLCTDRRPALAIRHFVDIPVALVLRRETEDEASDAAEETTEDTETVVRQRTAVADTASWEIDAAPDGSERLTAFQLGSNQLAVPKSIEGSRDRIEASLRKMAEMLDLAEPFGRIREAITEARRGG